MTVLIFGAGGQDAAYLAARCRAAGDTVVTASRAAGDVRADVADFAAVESLVRGRRPDRVFHLAANSRTAHGAALENHATIGTGTLNVLEAVYRHCPAAKVFITGSGVQFENAGRPIRETDPFAATSPYAVSRIASVYAARYYRSVGLRTYVGFLFHHESPLRKPHHMSQRIAQAARRIAAGSGEVLEIGDVEVRKEWTFAGDVVDGILCLVGQDEVSEATIGSGVAHSIRDWLQACFGVIGRDWRGSVRTKTDYRADFQCLVSDPATINGLGWRPRVGLGELARMMMADGEPVIT